MSDQTTQSSKFVWKQPAQPFQRSTKPKKDQEEIQQNGKVEKKEEQENGMKKGEQERTGKGKGGQNKRNQQQGTHQKVTEKKDLIKLEKK